MVTYCLGCPWMPIGGGTVKYIPSETIHDTQFREALERMMALKLCGVTKELLPWEDWTAILDTARLACAKVDGDEAVWHGLRVAARIVSRAHAEDHGRYNEFQYDAAIDLMAGRET